MLFSYALNCDTQHNKTWYKVLSSVAFSYCYAECRYAECHYAQRSNVTLTITNNQYNKSYHIIMLSLVIILMLSAILLNVVMVNVAALPKQLLVVRKAF
jgi:hypothetical protein